MEISQSHPKLYMSDLTKIKVDVVLNAPQVQNVRKEYLEPIHRMKDTEMAYRVINSWTELGLLNDSRKNQKEWRKFSILDVYWMIIIQNLRSFGIPLTVIKQIYDKLFPQKDTVERGLFELSILEAKSGNPIYMIIFAEGDFGIVNFDELVISEQVYKLGNYLKLDLSKIALEVMHSKDLDIHISPTISLSSYELQIIEAIRSGDFKSVKASIANKNVIIESEKDVDVASKLVDLLNSEEYQNIEIKKSGKIASIKQTVKNKVQEETNSPKFNRLTKLLNKAEFRPYIKAKDVGSNSQKLL